MLVHTDPNLEKAIILSFPRDLWVEIPGHGERQDQRRVRRRDRRRRRRSSWPRPSQNLTGLKIDHVLYVDLAGFQGVVDTLGGVDMCIPGENVNTRATSSPRRPTARSARSTTTTGHIVDLTGLDVKPGASGCRLTRRSPTSGRATSRATRWPGLRPDPAPAAVPAGGDQPDAAARAAGAAALDDRADPSNMRRDEGLDARRPHLSHRAAAGHLDRRRRVPGGPGLSGGFEHGLSVRRWTRRPSEIFAAIRQGKPLGTVRRGAPEHAAVGSQHRVPVVDHASGGTGDPGRPDVLSQAGFDIAPGDRRPTPSTAKSAQDQRDRVRARRTTPRRRSSRSTSRSWSCSRSRASRGRRRRVRRRPTTSPPPVRRRRRGRRAPVRSRTSDARAGAVGRRGLAAPAASPTPGQAADPRRRHADPVPRPGGDRRRRHHRGRHHRRSDRRRGPQRGRRRVPLGAAGHVHRAGRAARVWRTP